MDRVTLFCATGSRIFSEMSEIWVRVVVLRSLEVVLMTLRMSWRT